MNGDNRLKHIPPFPFESAYERDMHQMLYEEEQAFLRWEELGKCDNEPYEEQDGSDIS